VLIVGARRFRERADADQQSIETNVRRRMIAPNWHAVTGLSSLKRRIKTDVVHPCHGPIYR
jgi:hypothetical protein